MAVARRQISGVDSRAGAAGRPRHRLARWRDALRAVLDEGGPDVAYQPVVDLRRGTVAGYEALGRFTRWGQARPEEWYARATQVGLGPTLEAATTAKALTTARTLPNGCFMAVNLSVASLVSDEVQLVLESQRSLHGMVIELTDVHAAATTAALPAVLQHAHRAGALLAVDDSGSGYTGLHAILAVRPDIVKLDRSFVSGIDIDPAKLAMAEMLGTFAGRIDALLHAEGIERIEELDALLSIGVPLGQGFLLGRGEVGWTECAPVIADRIRERASLVSAGAVGRVMVPVAAEPARHAIELPLAPERVLVDDNGVAVGFCLAGGPPELPPGGPLRVLTTEPAALVLTHAMGRPAARRWEPIVAIDDEGRAVGLVHVDDLAGAIADEAVRGPRPPVTRRLDPAAGG